MGGSCFKRSILKKTEANTCKGKSFAENWRSSGLKKSLKLFIFTSLDFEIATRELNYGWREKKLSATILVLPDEKKMPTLIFRFKLEVWG